MAAVEGEPAPRVHERETSAARLGNVRRDSQPARRHLVNRVALTVPMPGRAVGEWQM